MAYLFYLLRYIDFFVTVENNHTVPSPKKIHSTSMSCFELVDVQLLHQEKLKTELPIERSFQEL